MKIFFFEESIWRERGEAWSERLSCSLREGSHSDKRYQINERDDEAGRSERGMIFLNCNHCCRQQSRDPSRWEILHSGGEKQQAWKKHEGKWVFQFHTIQNETVVLTTKSKVSANSEITDVTSWLCDCRRGLAGPLSQFWNTPRFPETSEWSKMLDRGLGREGEGSRFKAQCGRRGRFQSTFTAEVPLSKIPNSQMLI